MPRLTLEATADHVRRIAGDSNPTQAIIELIWNSLDAEANSISVSYDRSPFGAITNVSVKDTGHGISVDDITAEFGRIGDSWKARGNRHSKNNKRVVHGSKGQGRLRAFALGSHIQWVSTSFDTAGQKKTVTIEGHASTRNVFKWETTIAPADNPVGTIFTAYDNQKPSLNKLDKDSSRELIAATFAPMLLDNSDISITVDKTVLHPGDQVNRDTVHQQQVQLENDKQVDLQVRIIEWKQGTHRQIYYGESPGVATYVEDGQDVENQEAFSAYVSWPELDYHSEFISLGALAPDSVGILKASARDVIRKYFRDLRRQQRRRQIDEWKAQGIYPYRGEPRDDAERVERTLFDVVSGTISGQVARERLEAGLTLRLLKNVLNTQPGELISILNEIISLTEDERFSLIELLGTTPLSNLVQAGNMVRARQHFLTALDHFIYDKVDSRFIGERRHLHPMLERELWIFGEEYSLMSSERGLTEMLRSHLRLSGLPANVDRPVKTWDGKLGRTDLHLAVVRHEHDRNRHLIVELKAPSVTLEDNERAQLRKYGDVILDDPRFQSGSASWDLILVGGKIGSSVRRDILDPATGMFWNYNQEGPNMPKVSAYVRSWRDIIDENLRRLSFFTEALQQDPSVSESISFLRNRYAELLPEMLSGESQDPPETGVA